MIKIDISGGKNLAVAQQLAGNFLQSSVMENIKELIVWQKAMALVVLVYNSTKDFPDNEKYGLINQMRRAAVSIASNIAEGHMRTTSKDFRQFVAVARGSCSELETQNLLAHRLGYLSVSAYQELEEKIIEVAKMLSSFYSKLTS